MNNTSRWFLAAIVGLGVSGALAADPPKPAPPVAAPLLTEPPEVRLVTVAQDPLTAPGPVAGQGMKKVTGGQFTPQGWKTTANGDQMVIEIAEADGFEGALEIDLVGLDWVKANTSHNQDKIAFLSMFSNPSGCPHASHFGTNTDALWMLRTGRKPDNTPFFGQGFKVYWSARGASEAEPSMYTEKIPTAMERNTWAGWKEGTNTIRVFWSKTRYRFGVLVNGEKVLEVPYENQIEPFKYVFIGKSREFDSLVGPTFANLRVYGAEKGHVSAIPIPEVLISVPSNGAVFEAGTMIPFMVAPRVAGREITKVTFFQGDKQIGEDTTRPFGMSWDPGAAGRYAIKATALDARGTMLTTPVKYVTVTAAEERKP